MTYNHSRKHLPCAEDAPDGERQPLVILNEAARRSEGSGAPHRFSAKVFDTRFFATLP